MITFINDYLEYKALKGASVLTIRNYRSYLLRFHAFQQTDDITTVTLDMIDSFQTHLSLNGCSFKTQSFYLITLRGFFTWLRIRKGLSVLDPLTIELPKIRKTFQDALSEDEVKKLLRSTNLRVDGRRKTTTKTPGYNNAKYLIRSRAMLELLLSSGIRVSELCNLDVTDIDLKEKYFHVVGKGGKKRICFLNDTTVHWLKKYLVTRPHMTSFLFVQYSTRFTNQRLTTRSVERLCQAIGKRAGITKPVTPHTLRRTYAATLLRKGVDIRYIQELLGHESIQTTTLYTKLVQSDLEKVYRKAQRISVKDVKETEQVIISRESFQKLTGMVGKTMQRQKDILEQLEKKDKLSVIPQRKTYTIN